MAVYVKGNRWFIDYYLPDGGRKRGFCIRNGAVDLKIPIFSKERDYIEKAVYIRED